MRKILLSILLLILTVAGFSQNKHRLFSGMYLQWGYNTEKYTKSTLHFNSVVNGVPHNFTLYNAQAHDQNDMDAIFKEPVQLSVPQYNYRIGFYLNSSRTKALEINYDHAKYVVYDNQLLHAKGYIGNSYFDKDTAFDANQMHFEHTNGANFYHINFVRQYFLKNSHNHTNFSLLWKAGAGVLIPKTDITLSGHRVDNRFHVAGYCISAEGGARYLLNRRLFFEGTAKAGFANYTNSLAAGQGHVRHHFGYFEMIGTIGYQIKF